MSLGGEGVWLPRTALPGACWEAELLTSAPLLSKVTQSEPYILWSPGIKSRKTDSFIPFYKKTTNDKGPKTKAWGAPYIYGGPDSDGERLETSQAQQWLKYMLGHVTQILRDNVQCHFINVKKNQSSSSSGWPTTKPF